MKQTVTLDQVNAALSSGTPLPEGVEIVVAKFRITSRQESWTGRQLSDLEAAHVDPNEAVAVEVKLNPVYAPPAPDSEDRGNAAKENRIFGNATPAGSLAMLIKNPNAANRLSPLGQAFYVVLIPADG